MTNEPEMSTSVSETRTTSASDQAGLAQRLKRQISQLHRETKVLEEVKQLVDREIITTQQELHQFQIKRNAEHAKQQELDGLARQRLVMEEEVIRAEDKWNSQFVLCALAGYVCIVVCIETFVRIVAYLFGLRQFRVRWVSCLVVGVIVRTIVWVQGRERFVKDKEKEEAINVSHHASPSFHLVGVRADDGWNVQQAKANRERQWTLCLTFTGVCVLAGFGVSLALCYYGETDLLLVCRAMVLAGLLGANMWAHRLDGQA
ncbi:hypothetical protein LTR22_020771 [Elasticomyces elasticus]|nr:hypothetical protein LTR22_020771 [Elasticomyces elasticus]